MVRALLVLAALICGWLAYVSLDWGSTSYSNGGSATIWKLHWYGVALVAAAVVALLVAIFVSTPKKQG